MFNGMARVALAGALVLAASSMAAEGSKKKGDSSATTRPSQKQVVKTIRGEISAVDIENKTLNVEVKEKQEMKQVVVLTDGNTEFLLDGEPVSIVDLRQGMRVSFQPESGVATRVSAKSMTSREQKDFSKKKAAQGGQKAE